MVPDCLFCVIDERQTVVVQKKEAALHIHIIPREFKDQIYQLTHVDETELFEDLQEPEKHSILTLLQGE